MELLEILLACGMLSIAVWGIVYALLGHWPATMVELGFFVSASSSLLWIRRYPQQVDPIVKLNVAAVFITCVANTVVTGGLMSSGMFMIWGIIGPMATMIFLGLRRTVIIGLAFAIRGGMGGVETAQELRARRVRVPFVASSGYANDQVLSSFRDHGFDGALRKPYRLDDLAAALSGFLAHTI